MGKKPLERKTSYAEYRKLERLLSLICNYAKTQRLAKPMFTGTKGIYNALMLLRAFSSPTKMCSIQHILEENTGKNS